MDEAKCAICGTPLSPDRDPRRIYCSRLCNEKARGLRYRAARVLSNCLYCGVQVRSRHAKYCSESHARRHRVRLRRLALKCDNCGGPLPLRRHRFCSDTCKMAARRHETYGLTRDELAAMLAQHSVCAICGTANWGRKGPVVDHDHTTGRVRGILCGHCNMGLGRFRDNPDTLRMALEYLSR